MTGPALDGWRFLWACLLGLALGFFYVFLRPLRTRHSILADLLFFPVLFYVWLYLSFAICRGDIRIRYTAGLFVGAAACGISPQLRGDLFPFLWEKCVSLSDR